MASRVDLGTMSIDHIDAVNNSDVINLVAIIDAGLRQFSTCPSATQNGLHPADVDIADAFIAHFRSSFEHFAAMPELYMPKASPKPKVLPNPPTVNIVENARIQNLMYSLSALRTELLFSEDADRSNGFREQTAAVVIQPWLAKFEAYISLMRETLTDDASTWLPDSDIQDPGVNPNNPR